MGGTLVIFAKNPVSENVKTRLGQDIGKKKAREVYVKILNKLIKSNKDQDYNLIVYVYGETDYFSKYDIDVKQQSGYDLGERMLNAFRDELETPTKVVLIGSDIPTLGRSEILEAFQMLDDHDIVLGPSVDGGYYLVAMNRPLNIFGLDVWSHSNVLKDTIRIIEEKGYTYALLEEMRDIDTAQDLEYYKKTGYL